MRLIKTNKKGEAADKSQRELMGLILSLLVVVVVVALIFKLLALFSPQEDATAKALFLRIVDDIKYLEPNSSVTEFLGGQTKDNFKGQEGSWGLVVFPKQYLSGGPLSCNYIYYDSINTVDLSSREDVVVNCENGKVCACLFFATEKNEIIFAKCNSISKKLDLDKESCFLLKGPESDRYATKFYLNSGDDKFMIDVSKARITIPSSSEEDALAIFDDIAKRFEKQFENLKSGGTTAVLDKKFFNLSQLKALGDYGIAIYSEPIRDKDSPKIYLSLVKKPDNLDECFSSNGKLGKEDILEISSEMGDELFIYNKKDDENCRMYISETEVFKGKNFVVFADKYNPLNCNIYDGFLKYNNPSSNDYSPQFEKQLELILLFNDTLQPWEKFNLKPLGSNYVVASGKIKDKKDLRLK